MRTKSRQAEAVGQANQMRAALNIASHPDFIDDYGIWHSTGRPTSYVSYTHLGYEVRLRFSSDGEWVATCPHFDITTSFPNQIPENIQEILNDWLLAHIERPVSHDAHLRQCRPAVLELANRHSISPALALEIYEERGF